jgi:hypothetical protein
MVEKSVTYSFCRFGIIFEIIMMMVREEMVEKWGVYRFIPTLLSIGFPRHHQIGTRNPL